MVAGWRAKSANWRCSVSLVPLLHRHSAHPSAELCVGQSLPVPSFRASDAESSFMRDSTNPHCPPTRPASVGSAHVLECESGLDISGLRTRPVGKGNGRSNKRAGPSTSSVEPIQNPSHCFEFRRNGGGGKPVRIVADQIDSPGRVRFSCTIIGGTGRWPQSPTNEGHDASGG